MRPINLPRFIDSEYYHGLCAVERETNALRRTLGMPSNFDVMFEGGRRFVCPGCGRRVLTCDGDTHVPICMRRHPEHF